MREIVIKTYEAEDGTAFDTMEDCEAYEQRLEVDGAWKVDLGLKTQEVIGWIEQSAYRRNTERYKGQLVAAILAYRKYHFYQEHGVILRSNAAGEFTEAEAEAEAEADEQAS